MRELGSGWNLGRREEETGRGDRAGTKGTWPARGGGAAAVLGRRRRMGMGMVDLELLEEYVLFWAEFLQWP
jgi:hypothetical protein